MAKYKMKLFDYVFDEIRDGLRTIETRLLDEKRKAIRVSDIVEFYKLPNLDEKVSVEILGVYIFDSWEDLVKEIPLEKFGPRWESREELIAAGSGYSAEKEAIFRNVAFDIKLI